MRLLVFAMGMCLRNLDDDDPEFKRFGFTKHDVLGVLEKLGVNPAMASSAFQTFAPESDWRDDVK